MLSSVTPVTRTLLMKRRVRDQGYSRWAWRVLSRSTRQSSRSRSSSINPSARPPVDAARDVVPLHAAGAEADLAGLQRLDVVGRGEAAGAEELEEVAQPPCQPRAALLLGRQLPGGYLHEVRRDGRERAHRH